MELHYITDRSCETECCETKSLVMRDFITDPSDVGKTIPLFSASCFLVLTLSSTLTVRPPSNYQSSRTMASDTFPCLWQPKVVGKDREILNDWPLQRQTYKSTYAFGTKKVAFSRLPYEVRFMVFYWVAMYNLDDVDQVAPHWEPTQMMISHHLFKARTLSKVCADVGADVLVSLVRRPRFAHYGSITWPTRREVLTELSMLKQTRLRPMLQSLQWNLYPDARAFNPSNLGCRQVSLFNCLGRTSTLSKVIDDVQSLLPTPITICVREGSLGDIENAASRSGFSTTTFYLTIFTLLETLRKFGAGSQQAILHLFLGGHTTACTGVESSMFNALSSLTVTINDRPWASSLWCHVIGQCEYLRSLTFAYAKGDRDGNSDLEDILSTVFRPGLVHLEIRGYSFEVGGSSQTPQWCLPTFLMKHQRTLSSLNMIGVGPQDCSYWPAFLNQLRLRKEGVALKHCVITEPSGARGFHCERYDEVMDKLVKQYARRNHDYWWAPRDIGAYILS